MTLPSVCVVSPIQLLCVFEMAGVKGLEPSASSVTGKRSNQTELHPQNVRILFFISTHVRPSKNQPKLAWKQKLIVKEKKVYLSVYQDSYEQ